MRHEHRAMPVLNSAGMPPTDTLDRIKRRAVWSARVAIEMICVAVSVPGLDESMAWDTQRMKTGRPTQEDSSLLDLIDLQDAVQCLDALGLVLRPVPNQPSVIAFPPEIEQYDPWASIGGLLH